MRRQAKLDRPGHGVMLRFLEEDRSGEKHNWSGYQLVSREGEGKWAPKRPAMVVVEGDGDGD